MTKLQKIFNLDTDFRLLISILSSAETQNIVVTECEVHNDATIAISSDDTRIAVLLSANQYDQPDWLGKYNICPKTRK